jgi:hypothetical protein
MDEDMDGLWDFVEFYSQKAALEKTEEKTQGKTRLTWFYDEDEVLIRGEEDKNQDGRTDIWYLYDKGHLVQVQEDTNQDNKVDLWEEYDNTQSMIKRQRDLDFDGTPDFVDEAGNNGSGS